MKYIKIFEDFDKDYVKNSIKDILVELKDLGMKIEVWHHKPNKKESNDPNHKESYTVSIKGKQDINHSIDFIKSFNTNIIKDYVDTIIEFMNEFCPDFEVYFEYYDRNEQDLGESETLIINKNIAEVAFTFRKK